MTRKAEYVTVPDLPANTCGAIVFWRLAGETRMPDLVQAWQQQGLDTDWLPELPSPETALRRAVQSQRNKRLLIRPLARSGSWALVEERVAGDHDLHHQVEITVMLDRENDALLFSEEAPSRLRVKIEEDYHHHQTVLDQKDVSSWLTRNVSQKLRAVALRDGGGVYFVPRDHVTQYEAVSQALRAAGGHVLHSVPSLRSDQAVEAILDAITQEVRAEVEGMTSDIEQGSMGKRALSNRGQEADSLLDKVSTYESLLGRKLIDLRSSVDGLKRNVAMAILALDDSDD